MNFLLYENKEGKLDNRHYHKYAEDKWTNLEQTCPIISIDSQNLLIFMEVVCYDNKDDRIHVMINMYRTNA